MVSVRHKLAWVYHHLAIQTFTYDLCSRHKYFRTCFDGIYGLSDQRVQVVNRFSLGLKEATKSKMYNTIVLLNYK